MALLPMMTTSFVPPEHTIQLSSGTYSLECSPGCVVCMFPRLLEPRTETDRFNLLAWCKSVEARKKQPAPVGGTTIAVGTTITNIGTSNVTVNHGWTGLTYFSGTSGWSASTPGPPPLAGSPPPPPGGTVVKALP